MCHEHKHNNFKYIFEHLIKPIFEACTNRIIDTLELGTDMKHDMQMHETTFIKGNCQRRFKMKNTQKNMSTH